MYFLLVFLVEFYVMYVVLCIDEFECMYCEVVYVVI